MGRDREALMSEHQRDTDELIARFSSERQQLNDELARTMRDYDSQLTAAEHDHRQVTTTHCHYYYTPLLM